MHLFRPAIFDQSGDEGLPDWIHDLTGRPLVHATLGTAFNETSGVLETIIEAVTDLHFDLVVTVGRNRDPDALGPFPANVRVERYVPQSLILPHSDAVVCHGGCSTVMASLSAGLPMVLTPIAADQPLHAGMCRTLGIAVVVQGSELTPQGVRQAILQVLEDPTYRDRTRAVREEMTQLPGIEQAVRLLEQVAAD